ncbi:hypothetical protein [Aquirhabdus parva]|uniref:Secreted protein n=1 Tax=Aquirhabdus parva TaxID=2283318 RepID=A0A345P2Q9_9GAMM|nr:hypothetical protein [Aquirhabdus parva]AXI01568.1 hypothetical protein HYN46_00840 [Aquirhabdus parva]
MRFKLIIPLGLLLSLPLFLASCGGSHDDTSFNFIPTPSADDPFITLVRQQTDTPSAMSDESEPIDIVRVVATTPEDSEPQTVSF